MSPIVRSVKGVPRIVESFFRLSPVHPHSYCSYFSSHLKPPFDGIRPPVWSFTRVLRRSILRFPPVLHWCSSTCSLLVRSVSSVISVEQVLYRVCHRSRSYIGIFLVITVKRLFFLILSLQSGQLF